jgi:hypothetical protein
MCGRDEIADFGRLGRARRYAAVTPSHLRHVPPSPGPSCFLRRGGRPTHQRKRAALRRQAEPRRPARIIIVVVSTALRDAVHDCSNQIDSCGRRGGPTHVKAA